MDSPAWFVSYCCKYGRYGNFLLFLILIPVVSLIAVIILGIKARRNEQEISPLYFLSDRIAFFSFILGCFISSLDLWHGFNHLGIGVFEEKIIPLKASTEISIASLKFAIACGVSLVAIIISFIFKCIEKNPVNPVQNKPKK
jgi:hypothetical protein